MPLPYSKATWLQAGHGGMAAGPSGYAIAGAATAAAGYGGYASYGAYGTPDALAMGGGSSGSGYSPHGRPAFAFGRLLLGGRLLVVQPTGEGRQLSLCVLDCFACFVNNL